MDVDLDVRGDGLGAFPVSIPRPRRVNLYLIRVMCIHPPSGMIKMRLSFWYLTKSF